MSEGTRAKKGPAPLPPARHPAWLAASGPGWRVAGTSNTTGPLPDESPSRAALPEGAPKLRPSEIPVRPAWADPGEGAWAPGNWHPVGLQASRITDPSSSVDEVLRGPGSPLDLSTRSEMQRRFGHDFSQVRLHHDEPAARSALALGADAYTVGNDLVFARGRYDPSSAEGRYLLVHELAHVVQQQGRALAPGVSTVIAGSGDALEQAADNAADGVAGFSVTGDVDHGPVSAARAGSQRVAAGSAGRAMVQRQKTAEAKPKAPAAKATPKLVMGKVVFTKRAREAVLKGGALLPGPDNAHVFIGGDGVLGYDANNTDPADPFRWEKVKFIVDSGAKVRVDLVGLLDDIDVVRIGDGGAQKMKTSLRQAGALGLTFPTVALQRAVQPEGMLVAGPDSDTSEVYFSTAFTDASTSSLAHELFGHLYLALKGVPWTHPADPKKIKSSGTLEEKHGITDPFGGTYKGTVKDYIDLYVGSESFSAMASPTQFVSPQQLQSELKTFKADFKTKASGTVNGPWKVADSLGLSWEIVSANHAVAKTANPQLLTSIESDLATWYGTLTADQQYVLFSWLGKVRDDFSRKTALASALLAKLKPPAGMHVPEP